MKVILIATGSNNHKYDFGPPDNVDYLILRLYKLIQIHELLRLLSIKKK